MTTNTTIVALSAPSGFFTRGINNAGQILLVNSSASLTEVALSTNGITNDIGSFPGMLDGNAHLNDSGAVAFETNVTDTNGDVTAYNAYLWQNGQIVLLNPASSSFFEVWTLDGSNHVYGETSSNEYFIYQNGSFSTLNTPLSHIDASNTAGDLVGVESSHMPGATPGADAYLWKNGQLINLGITGNYFLVSPKAINADDQVICQEQTLNGPGPGTAALWTNGTMKNCQS